MFPPNVDNSCNPISEKKLTQGERQYSMQKTLLGFDFDGTNKTMWLEAAKQEKLLTLLKGWVQAGTRGTIGIPFKEFESMVAKIRHAFTCIPAGVGLLSLCNRVLRACPAYDFLNHNQRLLTPVEGCHTLLRKLTWEPTKCRELTCGWPDFVGIIDASGQGVGGVIIGELMLCSSTVFWWQWPADVTANIKTFCNPGGKTSNSDLEMAGHLLLWLTMEGVCGNLRKNEKRYSVIIHPPLGGWNAWHQNIPRWPNISSKPWQCALRQIKHAPSHSCTFWDIEMP